MLEVVLFLVAVIIVVKFWRIFLPLALGTAVLAGIGYLVVLATLTETFGPFKPTKEQVASGCTVGTLKGCETAGYPTSGGTPEQTRAAQQQFDDMIRESALAAKLKAEQAAAPPPPVQVAPPVVKQTWINPCPAPLMPLYGVPHAPGGYTCGPADGKPWPAGMQGQPTSVYINPNPKAG